MADPRRRLVRPAGPPAGRSQLQLQKLRERLSRERASLARWQARLKRAFNATQKHQKTVARIERQIHQQEGT